MSTDILHRTQYTFSIGGIHPRANKLTAGSPIRKAKLPPNVTIFLSQHLGAPAVCLVEKGQKVKTGTLIAKPQSFISAGIHSSVSGVVEKIEAMYDPCGYKRPAVIIRVEGDEWEESIDRSPDLIWKTGMSGPELVSRISDSGVVGLGGACFPTNVKYILPKGKTADTLIINGVECEPYLTSDHRLMLEKADEILIGIEILKTALSVRSAVIGIEANKPDAAELLSIKAADYPGTEVKLLKVQYPQGAEKQLIQALVQREVPSGKLPIDAGCVVDNIGTAFAVYEAVQKNKPLFERVVTVTGPNVAAPGNFLVRIGTPVRSILEECGGIPDNTAKIINGGPMMGKTLVNTEVPVTKGTSGILLLPEESACRKTEQNCIRCGRCVNVCPMGLTPFHLDVLSRHTRIDELETGGVLDCIECGNCSYVCPSSRSLLDYIRLGKMKTAHAVRERNKK